MIADLVSPRAVAIGAAVALAVCVPAALLAQVLDDAGSVDDDSSWLLALFGVILFGMALGGHAAAVRRLDAPLTNGALAALAAYLLVQGLGAIRLLASGDEAARHPGRRREQGEEGDGDPGDLVADHRARNPR